MRCSAMCGACCTTAARRILPAVDALYRFRAEHGPVILLTNAPRPIVDVESMFKRVGVPLDCYDAIVSSGALARDDVEQRIAEAGRTLKVYHLGPDRDGGVLGGLDIERVEWTQRRSCFAPACTTTTPKPRTITPSLFREMRARDLDHALRQSGHRGAARRQADLVRGRARRSL